MMPNSALEHPLSRVPPARWPRRRRSDGTRLPPRPGVVTRYPDLGPEGTWSNLAENRRRKARARTLCWHLLSERQASFRHPTIPDPGKPGSKRVFTGKYRMYRTKSRASCTPCEVSLPIVQRFLVQHLMLDQPPQAIIRYRIVKHRHHAKSPAQPDVPCAAKHPDRAGEES